MSSRMQYLFTETSISVAINAALSAAFVYVVFHGEPRIAASGRHGMIVDMAPQTFMIALMACLVPALLTRKRHTDGKLVWHVPGARTLVSSIWFRAFGIALLAACAVIAFSAAVFPHWFPTGISFRSLLVGKVLFGMALAAIVTPWAILRVLR